MKESGEIEGRVYTDKINETFNLYYSKYDNYAIVWTKKNYETHMTEPIPVIMAK
jgi:hypothetical protein